MHRRSRHPETDEVCSYVWRVKHGASTFWLRAQTLFHIVYETPLFILFFPFGRGVSGVPTGVPAAYHLVQVCNRRERDGCAVTWIDWIASVGPGKQGRGEVGD